jgi:tetratricopeptide (TPR) repeat protein
MTVTQDFDFPVLSRSPIIPAEVMRVLSQIDVGNMSVRRSVSRELSRLDEKTLLTLPELVERAVGADHPELAKTLHRLAVLYHSRNNLEKAEFLYRRAMDTAERAFQEPTLEWGLMINNFGRALYDQKKFDEAETVFRQAIELLQQTFGPRHRKLATPLSNLANLYRDQGNWVLAERMYESSLAILVEVLGPLHPRVVRTREKLAAVKARVEGDAG